MVCRCQCCCNYVLLQVCVAPAVHGAVDAVRLAVVVDDSDVLAVYSGGADDVVARAADCGVACDAIVVPCAAAADAVVNAAFVAAPAAVLWLLLPLLRFLSMPLLFVQSIAEVGVVAAAVAAALASGCLSSYCCCFARSLDIPQWAALGIQCSNRGSGTMWPNFGNSSGTTASCGR